MLHQQEQCKGRYALTFREGKIAGENWQIDPKLTVAAAN